MSEQLAIIRRPGYGTRDFRGKVGLWFDTYTSETSGALQCLFGEDADRVFHESGVYSVEKLEGKPCWVECEGGMMKFLRMAKLGEQA